MQRDAHQVRQLIGLTGQYASVDEGLSGTNNLIMIGRLLGMPGSGPATGGSCSAASTSRRGLGCKTYSGGMRRRLDLAASLVGRPQVLYLDEPTTGLDPRSRTDVWGMIRELVTDGVTVLLTTQYLDEADQLAHDIVVIDHGKVIATGTPDELKAKTGGQVLIVSPADPARMAEVAALLADLTQEEAVIDDEAETVTAAVADATLLPRIVRELDHRGIEIAEFTMRKASLDEVFLTLTGHLPEADQTDPTGEREDDHR